MGMWYNDNDRYSLHDTYKLKNARTPRTLHVGYTYWTLGFAHAYGEVRGVALTNGGVH